MAAGAGRLLVDVLTWSKLFEAGSSSTGQFCDQQLELLELMARLG